MDYRIKTPLSPGHVDVVKEHWHPLQQEGDREHFQHSVHGATFIQGLPQWLDVDAGCNEVCQNQQKVEAVET